jgi:hypothetical protein
MHFDNQAPAALSANSIQNFALSNICTCQTGKFYILKMVSYGKMMINRKMTLSSPNLNQKSGRDSILEFDKILKVIRVVKKGRLLVMTFAYRSSCSLSPPNPVAKITPVSSQFHNREAARSLEHNQQKGQRERDKKSLYQIQRIEQKTPNCREIGHVSI